MRGESVSDLSEDEDVEDSDQDENEKQAAVVDGENNDVIDSDSLTF